MSGDLKTAIGFNPEWNQIWTDILKVRNTTDCTVEEIEQQFDEEWNHWIRSLLNQKLDPNKSSNPKPILLWVKAIHNQMGGKKSMSTSFLVLFNSWLIPFMKKKKYIIVNGLLIEKFLLEIRQGEWITSAKDNPSQYNLIEFMTRGMEKAKFYL